MTLAYCGVAIMMAALALLIMSLWDKRPVSGLALVAAAIIFIVLLGDVHYTGKREVALVACGTAAAAAEQTISCPFR